jgi:hypothetical protein
MIKSMTGSTSHSLWREEVEKNLMKEDSAFNGQQEKVIFGFE